MRNINMKEEYSERFDELRKNRVETSFYKYGPAKKNYASGNLNSIMQQGIRNIWWMRPTI